MFETATPAVTASIRALGRPMLQFERPVDIYPDIQMCEYVCQIKANGEGIEN